MVASSYPSLGSDPCSGDLGGYQALAAYAGRSAAALADAVRVLASAGSQEWRRQAAVVFRAHVDVDQDVLPLARKASDWVGKAAVALCSWGVTVAGLQEDAALRSAGLPAGGTPSCPAGLKPGQKARLDEANIALSGILAEADELHSRYLAAAQRADGQLKDAGNMAPYPFGLFASLRHDATAIYGNAVHGVSGFVHDKGLLEFISGVAKIVAAIAELLALFPPLTAIFGPIAIAAAVAALGADALLAGFHHGSWGSVALDAVAMAPDVGWMKTASKLADIYKVSGLAGSMTQARALTGLVIGKTVEVAPGMFRMIGDSLKTAAGGVDATARALSKVTSGKAPRQEPVA